MFINGHSIIDSINAFEKMATLAFKRRAGLSIPLLSRVYEVLVSYINDGLYSVENMETALKEIFDPDKSILDCSYATSTGTRVALPVATVSKYPSCRIFTNYNGAR